MPEAYVRGNTIKYLRVPDEVLDKAKEADFRRDGEPPPSWRAAVPAGHAARLPWRPCV